MGPDSGLGAVTAVVLTHKRPRLASEAVRWLLEEEGFSGERVIVVINGEGGLDDPRLERSVKIVRTSSNLGPAGGFRRALLEAFSDATTQWAYLCEDDVSLLQLPTPRVADLVRRASAFASDAPVGAVVPFGRVVVGRSGHTINFVPRRGLDHDLAPVDVTTWGATLVAREVVEAGILPDPEMFFGFEDFDFFSAVRAAGFSVLVDVPCARRVAHTQTLAAREEALRAQRPTDAEEPWRAYYFARNFFTLARRHGRGSWYAWHLLYSARRIQLARSAEERRAILRGLIDGARHRLGMNPRYLRSVGERTVVSHEADEVVVPVDEHLRSRPDLECVALVLSHNAPLALRRCIEAITEQTLRPSAIIVVDNASSPPVELGDLRAGGLPVRVVRLEVNGGPGGGWARAFEEFLAGTFDHAWVLDDDIIADPDCLETLWKQAQADPKGAFCFPWSVQPDGSAGAWGAWCGFLISRHIVERVGVPRADFFWWAEDNEYCLWRIPHAGFERKIVAGAVVQHDAVRHEAGVPTWKYYYEARNMLYLHLHLMHRVGWYPRNVTKLAGRALVHERGRRLRSLSAMARGLFDGATGRLGVRFPVVPMHEQPATAASSSER